LLVDLSAVTVIQVREDRVRGERIGQSLLETPRDLVQGPRSDCRGDRQPGAPSYTCV